MMVERSQRLVTTSMRNARTLYHAKMQIKSTRASKRWLDSYCCLIVMVIVMKVPRSLAICNNLYTVNSMVKMPSRVNCQVLKMVYAVVLRYLN